MEKTDQQIYEEFASKALPVGEKMGPHLWTGNQDISYGLVFRKTPAKASHQMEFRLTNGSPGMNVCQLFFRYALYQQAGLECVSQRNGLL